MSTYYSFYAGKLKDGKISFLGPFIKTDEGEFEKTPILYRSRSFIDTDDFSVMGQKLTSDMLAEGDVATICSDFEHATWRCIPYREVVGKAGDGLVKGYATFDQLSAAIACNYDLFGDWMYPIYPPEVVAEMPAEERRKYGHIAYIDTMSTEYLCGLLMQISDPYDYGAEEEDFVFLMQIA